MRGNIEMNLLLARTCNSDTHVFRRRRRFKHTSEARPAPVGGAEFQVVLAHLFFSLCAFPSFYFLLLVCAIRLSDLTLHCAPNGIVAFAFLCWLRIATGLQDCR